MMTSMITELYEMILLQPKRKRVELEIYQSRRKKGSSMNGFVIDMDSLRKFNNKFLDNEEYCIQCIDKAKDNESACSIYNMILEMNFNNPQSTILKNLLMSARKLYQISQQQVERSPSLKAGTDNQMLCEV